MRNGLRQEKAMKVMTVSERVVRRAERQSQHRNERHALLQLLLPAMGQQLHVFAVICRKLDSQWPSHSEPDVALGEFFL